MFFFYLFLRFSLRFLILTECNIKYLFFFTLGLIEYRITYQINCFSYEYVNFFLSIRWFEKINLINLVYYFCSCKINLLSDFIRQQWVKLCTDKDEGSRIAAVHVRAAAANVRGALRGAGGEGGSPRAPPRPRHRQPATCR